MTDNRLQTNSLNESAPEESGNYPHSFKPDFLASEEAAARQARLAKVIAGEIVPRLLLLHHEAAKPEGECPSVDEIAAFGTLVMGPAIEPAIACFERMQAKGHSLETLFVRFLAPTARHLGELWEADRCDFLDVTIGVARLREILARFGSLSEHLVADLRQKVLLVTPAGEKHNFGVEIVAKFLVDAGWEVAEDAGVSARECARRVSEEWFAVVGLTISVEEHLELLARTIEAVRKASLNRNVGIMVGGPLFERNPDFVALVGADACAADAQAAVALAKRLLVMGSVRH